jgi:hypothetical protein
MRQVEPRLLLQHLAQQVREAAWPARGEGHRLAARARQQVR